MSKENHNWNDVHEKNVEQCLHLINDYDFDGLQLPPEMNDFIQDLSYHYQCDAKVLVFTILSAIGHYCETINVYNLETKQLKPITEYEVLIAPSGIYHRIQYYYSIFSYSIAF